MGSTVISLFNNREIATGVWLVIIVIWAAKIDGMRESFEQVLRSFLHPKIIGTILFMAGYVWLGVLLLQHFTLWNLSLLKDTIYWFFLTGLVLLFNFMGEKEGVSFLKKTAIACVAVTVFLQFLLNLYTFPLWGELIFIPVISLLVMMIVVAESKPECAPAKKLFDGILSVIGLCLVIHLLRMTWLHHSELSVSNLLISFLLPILLTFLFFPFLYVAKLIANYELFFVRLKLHISNDADLLKYTRARTLQHCHVNLPRLDRFEKFLLNNLWDTRDRDGINRIIHRFEAGQINEN